MELIVIIITRTWNEANSACDGNNASKFGIDCNGIFCIYSIHFSVIANIQQSNFFLDTFRFPLGVVPLPSDLYSFYPCLIFDMHNKNEMIPGWALEWIGWESERNLNVTLGVASIQTTEISADYATH